MDSQSFFGKVPFGVAERSGDAPVTAVVGIFEGDRHVAERLGISHIIETNPKHLPFEQIKSRAKEDLTTAAGMIEV